MANPVVFNPLDLKVVQFTNSEDFEFTPGMGCMYDGRPISGPSGAPGFKSGESMTLPYHVGNCLAANLAKQTLLRRPARKNADGKEGDFPLWDDGILLNQKALYMKDLYSEEKPIAMTETDRLMAKVEEYRKAVEQLMAAKGAEVPTNTPTPEVASDIVVPPPTESAFKDKQEVIAALEARGIAHDKRSTKANLELLLKPKAE